MNRQAVMESYLAVSYPVDCWKGMRANDGDGWSSVEREKGTTASRSVMTLVVDNCYLVATTRLGLMYVIIDIYSLLTYNWQS